MRTILNVIERIDNYCAIENIGVLINEVMSWMNRINLRDSREAEGEKEGGEKRNIYHHSLFSLNPYYKTRVQL